MSVVCLVCGGRIKKGARGKWTRSWPLCPKHHDEIVAIEKARETYAQRKERFELQKDFRRAYPGIEITAPEPFPELIGMSPPALPTHADLQLVRSVDEFEFSIRTANVLQSHGITHIGQLVQVPAAEMKRWLHAGKKTIADIEHELGSIGLHMGMTVPHWKDLCDEHDITAPFPIPRENVSEYVKTALARNPKNTTHTKESP
jgi:hypothetical protein